MTATLATLRKLAADLKIPGRSKMSKTELAAAIDAEYAKRDNTPERRMINRVNGYMRHNGTDKLTPAQWRRVRKNERRHGINVNKLVLDFP